MTTRDKDIASTYERDLASRDRVADYLISQIATARRKTRNYLLRWGVVMTIAVVSLILLAAWLPARIAHPGWTAELVEVEAGNALPKMVSHAKQRLLDSAPQLTKRMRRETLRALPRLVTDIKGDCVRHTERTLADFSENLDDILNAAIDSVDPPVVDIINAEGPLEPATSEQLERDFKTALETTYRVPTTDERGYPDAADVLKATTDKLMTVAEGEQLTPEEFLLRQTLEHALGFLTDPEALHQNRTDD